MEITRRACLWLLALAPLLAQDRVQPLTILHSNDLHAHLLPDATGAGGFAYLAATVRQERSRCAACLYLNAGDLVQGTPVSTLFHGVPVYEIGNGLGFDAAVIGNHEFDYGWRSVQKFAKIAKYPVLSANVVNDAGNPITGKAFVILNAGGMRVAVIGVVMGDMMGTLVTPKDAGPWHVAPLIETIRKYVAEVKDRADLIVVLGHIKDQEGDEILRDVPEVGVVVMGHDHRGLTEMRRVDGRVGVLLRGYGVELGRLDLQVNVATHSIKSAEWTRIPIDSKKIEPAADVARSVAQWESKASKIVDVPVGESKRSLSVDDLRVLIEKAMQEETHSDLAYMNHGGVRDVIPAGQLLARNVWNVLPFEDYVVTAKCKGSQLPKAVAGGRSIDPDREYTFATVDFVATVEFAKSRIVFTNSGLLIRDLMIDWIKKKKVLD
ncbi:MAG TPA: bifunctional UDP-sugar hydrolase/5'-nucleotidase [Bryobacteraceae bacterium]|nr:bifunctional UDP-sugar hydrolase/5'-nucleotidase [Bryobacteraceae bacterium]